MSLSLIELVRTDFRTTKPADELNSRFQHLLGLPHRYGPARLAIGRSLGIAHPPKLETSFTGFGKPIKGENLFGTGADLACWITLIVQHAAPDQLDRAQLQQFVAAHWGRGIYLLWDDWKASLSDFDTFVARQADRAVSRKAVAVSRLARG
ncbi:DndE family protein [Bosea sp. NPDC055332]